MNIFIWLLFGAVVGLVIHLLDPARVRGGVSSTLLLGVAGALFGGFLATVIIGRSLISFSIPGLALALIGGIVLGMISRWIFRERKHIKTSTMRLRKA